MTRLSLLLLAACAGTSAEVDVAPPDSEPADSPDTPEVVADLHARHRLGRDEILFAVRDLLFVDSAVLQTLPIEPDADGFRNIAESLELSTLLFDRLAAGAIEVARAVLADQRRALPVPTVHHEIEYAGWQAGWRFNSFFEDPMGSPWWAWADDAPRELEIHARGEGTYRIELHASRPGVVHAGEALLDVAIDGVSIAQVELVSGPDDPQLLTLSAPLTAGSHLLRFTTLEGAADPAAPPPTDPSDPEGGAVALDYVRVTGPIEAGLASTSPRDALLICDPGESSVQACAEAILRPLAQRAWRRPVSEEEVADMVGLVQEAVDLELGFEVGLEYGMRRILQSPHFLFRLELHSDAVAGEPPHPWQAFELASRLSFFLWSSVPDEALYTCAATGALLDDDGPCSLDSQLTRMLDDPRAEALITGWASQWLDLREMDDLFKEWHKFPGFTHDIAKDMVGETHSVVREFVHGDQALNEITSMDWTYLNNRLAEYYDLPPPGSDTLVRTELTTDQRSGLVTHGSVMTVTAYESRTKPIGRAIWLLDTFLCTNLGAPPQGIPQLSEEVGFVEAFAQHADPSCRTCHDVLDPLGLVLENYDAAGAWRDLAEDGTPIVIDAAMPDGTPIQHPADVGAYLAADPKFATCLVAKIGAYATGQAYLTSTAPAAVREVTEQAEAAQFRFHDIAREWIHHPLFTHLTSGAEP